MTLLTKELCRPNGLAFSPDEKILYVGNSDAANPVVMAYPVKADGTLGGGKSVLRHGTARQSTGRKGAPGRDEGGRSRQPLHDRARRRAGRSPRTARISARS